MTAQPLKTEQWFTSPWNHDPVVRETMNLPDRVQIHDTSRRDGAQQAGLLFTAKQKVRIAAAELGHHNLTEREFAELLQSVRASAPSVAG